MNPMQGNKLSFVILNIDHFNMSPISNVRLSKNVESILH